MEICLKKKNKKQKNKQKKNKTNKQTNKQTNKKKQVFFIHLSFFNQNFQNDRSLGDKFVFFIRKSKNNLWLWSELKRGSWEPYMAYHWIWEYSLRDLRSGSQVVAGCISTTAGRYPRVSTGSWPYVPAKDTSYSVPITQITHLQYITCEFPYLKVLFSLSGRPWPNFPSSCQFFFFFFLSKSRNSYKNLKIFLSFCEIWKKKYFDGPRSLMSPTIAICEWCKLTPDLDPSPTRTISWIGFCTPFHVYIPTREFTFPHSKFLHKKCISACFYPLKYTLIRL